MRIFIVLAVAAVVVAIAFGTKTFIAEPAALATSVSLSPHEIHLNYKNMKELPVHEGNNAF